MAFSRFFHIAFLHEIELRTLPLQRESGWGKRLEKGGVVTGEQWCRAEEEEQIHLATKKKGFWEHRNLPLFLSRGTNFASLPAHALWSGLRLAISVVEGFPIWDEGIIKLIFVGSGKMPRINMDFTVAKWHKKLLSHLIRRLWQQDSEGSGRS